VNVGEPITEVHSEGGQVVVPVVCLIEAARQVGEDMPRLLIENPACKVEALAEDRWAVLAAGAHVLGRLDLASAFLTATMGRGYVLTAEPDAYGEPGENFVIPV
jgi:hypothetical protein